MITRPVGEDRRIDDFAARAALPGVERPYEVIELLGIHSAFTLWTFHAFTPLTWFVFPDPPKDISRVMPCARGKGMKEEGNVGGVMKFYLYSTACAGQKNSPQAAIRPGPIPRTRCRLGKAPKLPFF
jgi:hypothetical protein